MTGGQVGGGATVGLAAAVVGLMIVTKDTMLTNLGKRKVTSPPPSTTGYPVGNDF